MNRYTGFSAHRYGDIFMNLAAWHTIKRLDPDAHVTLLLNGNYRSAAPLFLDQPDIDSIHITHSPIGDFDKVDLEWLRKGGFHTTFSLMQDHDHSRPWFLNRNQPQEVCYMHGLPVLDDGKLRLNRWFGHNENSKDLGKFVALQAFAGSYDPANTKMLSPKRAQEIVNLILARGYQVLQLGLPTEYRLDKTLFIDTDFFGAVRNLLGCRALVTTDSGFNWAASCYDHPTLGLYSNAYYGKERVGAIQPINPNAIYLDAANINDIPIHMIDAALTTLLS